MKNRMNTGYSKKLRQASAIILCMIIMIGLNMHLPRASAQNLTPPPSIIIVGQAGNGTPSNVLNLKINDTFTMTMGLTNYPDLYVYQIVFKYNQTMLNMTDLRFLYPTNVFGSQSTIPATLAPINGTDPTTLIDTADGFGFAVAGQSLLGPVGVKVVSGILFETDFTVVANGTTSIQISTVSNPALQPPTKTQWYSLAEDSNVSLWGGLGATTTFDISQASLTILAGKSTANPVALYTAYGTTVDPNTRLIIPEIQGNYPEVTNVLANRTTYFNASNSYAPTGNITAYIWDFGDSNRTVINATGSPTDALINHVFTDVGVFLVNLTIVSETETTVGNTTLITVENSPVFSYPIAVGEDLPIFDWWPFIYVVFGLIVAGIVISSVRSAMRKARKRRLRQQKTLAATSSQQPPTGIQTG